MPFALPTYDDLVADFKADVRIEIPGAATQDGSDYAAIAVCTANVALPMYANGKYLAAQAFPDTADTVGLQKFADVFSVPRLGAQFSAGQMTVQSSVPTTIADGTTLVNPSSGNRYETVGITTIGVSLEGVANIVALQNGQGSDSDPGTVLQFESTPPVLNPTATVVSLSGGDDAWDNERWAQEILKQIAARAQAGNAPHIIAIGDSIGGVEQVFVYPALRGTGTLDVVLTTSAASGTRVAGPVLLARMLGALQQGIKPTGGTTIPGIPEDVFANTIVQAAIEQPTDIIIAYRASIANPFGPWPRAGAGFQTSIDTDTWYRIASSSSLLTFVVNVPVDGTPVTPKVGNAIGVFFPSVGFCKGTITVVSGGGPWTITVDAWSGSPTEAAPPTGAVISPWCSQLPNIAGPAVSPSKALSGAIPTFFAALGPGEMTALTVDDVTRRRRWPATTDISPFTGLAAWPTDVTSRLSSMLATATDGVDFSAATPDGTPTTPVVPSSSFLGTPPSILTVGMVSVVPMTS